MSNQYVNKDLIFELIKNMDVDSIQNTCYASVDIHQLCQTKMVKNVIISKLQDSMNLSQFTLNQLFFYNKVIPLKRKIIVVNDKIYVNFNNKLMNIRLNVPKVLIALNSNQILPYDHNHVMVLDNDGYLFLYNHTTLTTSFLLDKVVDVHYALRFKIITLDGTYDLYPTFKNKLPRFVLEQPNNIIQNDLYLLNDDGEVYRKWLIDKHNRFVKIEGLPKIIQITSSGYFLAYNGDVYYYDRDEESINTIPIHNIVQITAVKELRNKYEAVVAFLDIHGDVFMGDLPLKVNEVSDIIEISFLNHQLVALDKNLMLHLFRNEDVETYDFSKI